MSLTLKDLRVHRIEKGGDYGDQRDPLGEPASLADLVEVLKDNGAWERWIDYDDTDPSLSGTYLVLPLGDTP